MNPDRTTAALTPVVVTPLVRLAGGSWRELLVKDETKQVSGAFKYRGVRHRISAVSPGTGLATASTGNHAAALALAARDHGCQLHVFLPATTPAAKQAKAVRYGARLHMVEGSYDDCAARASDFASRHGLDYIHSFDDLCIIEGHQGLFDEVDRAVPRPDTVFVPVGGGGLAAAAVRAWGRSGTHVIGVEHAAAPAMARSLRLGKSVPVDVPAGRAEGLLVRRVGAHPFAICAAHGLTVETVSDCEIETAIRILYEELGIRAEYAGAAAVAAALRHYAPEQRALCVVSGGNIDADRWYDCLGVPERSVFRPMGIRGSGARHSLG